MTHRIHTVDVFAEKALAGNQLAVVLDAEDIPDDVMQRIAKEMNISETTFVLPPADPAHAARVRIFTPASELQFAGHPTVGTAWVTKMGRQSFIHIELTYRGSEDVPSHIEVGGAVRRVITGTLLT